MELLKPKYIVFEGGEACGKSTQVELLSENIGALATREPGGTHIGAGLRSILLDPQTEDLSTMAEVFLMAADRAQHMHQIVGPNLTAGRSVVSDRSFVSSVAYQGAGRELGAEFMMDINLANPELILPDQLFILLPPDEVERARRLGGNLDRFESAHKSFHQRLHDCFMHMDDLLAWDPRTQDIQVIKIEPTENGVYKTPGEIQQEVMSWM